MNNHQNPPHPHRRPYFTFLSQVNMHTEAKGFDDAKLTFPILFARGSDRLSDIDTVRVKILAEYLSLNPKLLVNLAGHTDPKGTDEYNNVLSLERAKCIQTELSRLGVDESRITYNGHGSDFSIATIRDYDAYHFERRVDVEMIHQSRKPR